MNRELFVSTALKYEGYPCLSAAKNPGKGYGPAGFHCSGYIIFLLRELGFPLLPSILTARQLFDLVGILVHEECAERGDLIFFSRHGRWPTHVGILLDETSYLSSPGITDSVVCIREIPHCRFNKKPGIIYAQSPIGYKRLFAVSPSAK
ncbi:MAG TPA: NlpC/P60 family protein [Candidatus Paceibacterota bacterium]|nr:NlpC/P60 family protein [Candidatus Paceibacterota bacterium]